MTENNEGSHLRALVAGQGGSFTAALIAALRAPERDALSSEQPVRQPDRAFGPVGREGERGPGGGDHNPFRDLILTLTAGQAGTEEGDAQHQILLERAARWYLHSASAAAGAVQHVYTLHLEEAAAPEPSPASFADRRDALEWYRAEQADLLTLVRAVAAAGLDELAWQLPVASLGLNIALDSPQTWLAMSEIAVNAAVRLGDAHAEALSRHSLGIAAAAAGLLQQAAEQFQAAHDLLSALGDEATASQHAHSAALLALARRDLPSARAGFEASLDAARRHGDSARQSAALCCLAAVALERGELGNAATLAEEALAVHAEAEADPYLGFDPLLVLARIDREEERFEHAGEVLDQCDALASQLGYRALGRAVLLARAELALAFGAHEQALELYWTLASVPGPAGDRAEHAAILDGTGRALRALGRLPEAIEAHRLALELARDCARPWLSAVTHAHLAEALAQAGEPGPASAAATQAGSLLDAFPDPRAEELRTRIRTLL
jgi:tetratricopeptide (TPR) repeat protein